jgi:putative transposase
MIEEHGLPIVRTCQAARLSRAAYYRPGTDWAARDAEVIAALQAIVTEDLRWGFWKCHDRLRAQPWIQPVDATDWLNRSAGVS